MNKILIQKPSDHPDQWRECPIIQTQFDNYGIHAEVKIKGVSPHENVTTLIIINDLKSFLKGEVVSSLHGYFKLKMYEGTKHLFTESEQ